MVVRGGIPSNSVIEIKKHRLDDHSKVEVFGSLLEESMEEGHE